MMAPIGMPIAKRHRIDPMLMALAIGSGLSAGAFAPTSLFGIVTRGVAQRAGVELDPLALFAVAVVVNFLLLVIAFLMFGGPVLASRRGAQPSPAGRRYQLARAHRARSQLTAHQIVTLSSMVGLVVTVIGESPDRRQLGHRRALLRLRRGVGVGRSHVPGGLRCSQDRLVDGAVGRRHRHLRRRAQTMGTVDMLGDAATRLGAPLLTALVICFIGARSPPLPRPPESSPLWSRWLCLWWLREKSPAGLS